MMVDLDKRVAIPPCKTQEVRDKSHLHGLAAYTFVYEHRTFAYEFDQLFISLESYFSRRAYPLLLYLVTAKIICYRSVTQIWHSV